MKEMSQALLGQKLADEVAKAASDLERRYGNEVARGLLGSVDQETFTALKTGTATRKQMVDAVTALTDVGAGLFRQQLASKGTPQGIGGARGEAACKSNPQRPPGTKYRDFHGRLRTEPDTPHLDLPPVKQAASVELTGREPLTGRRIRDDAFKKEQAERHKRDHRRAAGQRLTD
jgi:hypothetical protein